MLRWLKRIALVLVGLMAVLAAFIGVVYFFGSEEERADLGHLYALAIANQSPPPIAQSGVIPTGRDWMMPEPASTKFTAILRKRFPPGSDVREMRAVLLAQGFEVVKVDDCGDTKGTVHLIGAAPHCPMRDLANALEYKWGGDVCVSRLHVRWAADRKDRLASIQGYYSAECL